MRAGHRLWSADIATPRDAFDVFGESIPAELSAETVRHAGSLISSIRRSWEVTPTLARAGGLGQENGALVVAREAAVANFRESLPLLGGLGVPRRGMKAFTFGDHNWAARQTVVERLVGTGRQ